MKAALVLALFCMAASQVFAACDIDSIEKNAKDLVDSTLNFKEEAIEEFNELKEEILNCIQKFSTNSVSCVVSAFEDKESVLLDDLKNYEDSVTADVAQLKTEVEACI